MEAVASSDSQIMNRDLPIKALSLHQPFASLIALQFKSVETRSWPTSYRGPIAIHAAKTWNNELEELCQTWPFGDILPADDLPRGCVVAVARLADCRRSTEKTAEHAFNAVTIANMDEEPCEFHFGDFSAGRWLWKFKDVHAVDPIPVKGAQGLWEWTAPASVLQLLYE